MVTIVLRRRCWRGECPKLGFVLIALRIGQHLRRKGGRRFWSQGRRWRANPGLWIREHLRCKRPANSFGVKRPANTFGVKTCEYLRCECFTERQLRNSNDDVVE